MSHLDFFEVAHVFFHPKMPPKELGDSISPKNSALSGGPSGQFGRYRRIDCFVSTCLMLVNLGLNCLDQTTPKKKKEKKERSQAMNFDYFCIKFSNNDSHFRQEKPK